MDNLWFTVKVAGIGAFPGVGIAVVRVRTVLVDQTFYKINTLSEGFFLPFESNEKLLTAQK